MKIEAKLWPLESEQSFKEILPSDLVFNLAWPIFRLDRDIIQTNILVKLYEGWSKMWPVEGEQSFKEIWASDLKFLTQHDHIWTWPGYHHVKHSGKVSWRVKQKCSL